MRRKRTVYLVSLGLAMGVLVAGTGFAATGDWTAGTNNWDNNDHWSGATYPGSPGGTTTTDRANIQNGGTAQVNTDITIGILTLANAAAGSGSLEILNGGTLTASSSRSTLVQSGTSTGNLAINTGGSMIFAGQDIYTTFHSGDKLTITLDGGYLGIHRFASVSGNQGDSADGVNTGVVWNLNSGEFTFCQMNANQPFVLDDSHAVVISPGGVGGTGGCRYYGSSKSANVFSLGSNSTFHVDIGGETQYGGQAWDPDTPGKYDYFTTDSSGMSPMTLAGNLTVAFANGFSGDSLDGSETFTVIYAQGGFGGSTFDNLTDEGKVITEDGGLFTVTYNATTVVLSDYQPPPKGTVVSIK
jgi:hypothetical protein